MPLLEWYNHDINTDPSIIGIRPFMSTSLSNVIVLTPEESTDLTRNLSNAARTANSVDDYGTKKQELLNQYYRKYRVTEECA